MKRPESSVPSAGLRRLIVAGVVLAFALLRGGQLISIHTETFDHEFHALGTLALDLQHVPPAVDVLGGAAECWHTPQGSPDAVFLTDRWPADLGEIPATYRYGAAGNTTLITQGLHALLATVRGPSSKTLRLTSVLAELFLVGLLAAFLLRLAPAWAVVAGLLPWLLPMGFAVEWQLLPYANHTEFLWVPIGLLWLLHRARSGASPRSSWILAWGLGLAGLVLYLGSMSGLVAFALVGAATGKGWKERLTPVGVATAAWACVALWSDPSLGVMVEGSPRLAPSALLGPAAWAEALERAYPMSMTLPGPLAALKMEVLIGLGCLGALLSLRLPGTPRLLAGFALVWAGVAFLLATLVPHSAQRYYLPSYYGMLLCSTVLPVIWTGRLRLVAASLCLLLGLSGLTDNTARLRPADWEQTRSFDSLGLTARLGVLCARLDELPYYAVLLEEGRSRWTGLILPTYRPEPSGDFRCAGIGSREPYRDYLGERLAKVSDEPTRARLLGDVGRGAWISHDRSLADVASHLRELGLDPAISDAILAGARAEAARWASVP